MPARKIAAPVAKRAPEPKLNMEQAKAKLETLKHPRVTEETMKAQIESVAYMTPENAPITTICVLKMTNDFVFIGTSTPAAPENYNAAIGQRYAYENALRQIWTHEGYLLKWLLDLHAEADAANAGVVDIAVLLRERFHVPAKPASKARSKGVR